MNKIFLLFCLIFSNIPGKAQEFNARVTVVASQVDNTIARSTFTTLQTALNNFLNNRKWTNVANAINEKIDCNFLLNLVQTSETNVYSASLTVQAARPIFNTSYSSPIVNYKDDNVLFKYIEFQLLEFNENRVTGSDPLISNLTAVFAYYAYMIIAFDNLSFSPKGGDIQFQKAQNIVNNSPEGRGISGWSSFDGQRNRYRLVGNMLDSRLNVMHDVYYNYYRLGLDKMYDDENAARAEILNVLNLLNTFNTENPNTMINQFFFEGKSNEFIKVFSKGSAMDKARASELLQKLDLTHVNAYKEQLK